MSAQRVSHNTQYDADREAYLRAVRRAAARIRRRRRLTFLEGLAMVGAVGWIVVLPTLAGAALGHALDARQSAGVGTGATLALLLAGLLVGCVAAWRHVARELAA